MKKTLNEVKNLLQQFSYILTKRQKRYSIGLFVLLLIGAMFETLGISVVIPLMQAMLQPGELMNHNLVQPVLGLLNIYNSKSLIIYLCVGTIVIYIIKNIYLVMLSYLKAKFACMVQQELSVRVMKSYLKRNYIFFTQINSSELLRGVGEDVNRVYNMLSNSFRIMTEALTSTMICAFIVYSDVIMAISVMILAITCFSVISYLFKDRMKKMGRLRQYHDTKTRKIAFEAFHGIKEISILECKNYFINNYEESYQKQQKAAVNETVANESPAYMIEAVCVSGLIGAVGLRILGGDNIENLIPQFAAFAVAAFRILPSMARITSAYNLMVFNKPGFDTIYKNLHEIQEYEKKASCVESSLKNISFKEALMLKDITWKYPGETDEVLKNVSLTINKGTAIGIIGESGSGKSTLIDILLGLLQPESGSVTIDGKDIRSSFTQKNKIISYVSQSIFLLDDTLLRNIAFGIPDEEIDINKVNNAVELAQLKAFIDTLPGGLDTFVGERGTRLSGGQRQRVAIARALYHDPEILVLDEATSALDNKTENAVMEAIENLQGKKTLIIVAHRLTTIEKCDEIYEVKNKKIIRKR